MSEPSTTIVTRQPNGPASTFKTSLQLQTLKPTAASVTAALRGTSTESDPNEARYWKSVYGLGTHQYANPKKKFAHTRKLILKPTTGTAIVQQVLFGPAATSAGSSRAPLAVVGGPRIYLYGTNIVSAFTRHLAKHTSTTGAEIEVAADRMVQTGGHLALAADFRNDGRLLAIATEMGEVRVCDVTMRATLCTFATQNSQLPMRAVAWFRNGQNILSGGDDAILRVWSLSSAGGGNAKPLMELTGHGDAIRAVILWQNSSSSTANNTETIAYNQLAFSGSYDHTIRVWNVDDEASEEGEDRCLAVLSHGEPVETLLAMSSADPDKVPVWLLSAGGVTVKVWNPLTGECVTTIVTQHRKTITSLLPILRASKSNDGSAYVQDEIPSWRIVTGSLDGCIRIHTWSPVTGHLQHIHGLQVGEGAPITALAVNNTGERLAIGTTTGLVMVRQRGPSKQPHKRKRPPIAGTYAHFTRGQNVTADVAIAGESGGDYVLQSTKKKKLRKYDQYLKQFRYGDALDEAMETRQPPVVVAVLEELGKRKGLTAALSNRDEESLEPILAFLVRYVTRSNFTRVLIGVAHAIIDIYGDVAGQSETIDELFVKLKEQVGNEVKVQKFLHRLVGQLDAVIDSNRATGSSDDDE